MRDHEMIRGAIPMTKMEVRAVILDYLELYDAKSFLDVGAGTGSVAIEAKRRHPQLTVTAIEREVEGVELIRLNAERLVRSEVTVIEGTAPCDELKGPVDRVFLGGTGRAMSDILTWLMEDHLVEGAIIVISAITLETQQEAFELLRRFDFKDIEGSQVQASRLETLGSYHYFKPLNPCTIVKGVYRP